MICGAGWARATWQRVQREADYYPHDLGALVRLMPPCGEGCIYCDYYAALDAANAAWMGRAGVRERGL